MSTREYSRQHATEIRAKYKALGLCYYCKTTPFEAGSSMCAGCRDRRRVYLAKRTETLKSSGMCPSCAKHPVVPKRRLCAACAAQRAKTSAADRVRFKALGICPTCRKGQLSADGRGGVSRCPVCYVKEQKRSKRNYHAIKASGMCVQCNKVPMLPGKTACAGCIRRKLLVRFESQGLTEALLDSLKYECGICGKTENLHLDHNHSTNEIRQWLCSHCNHGIGHFFEDTTLLFKAMGYIERHNGPKFSQQFYRGRKWTTTEPPLGN